MTILISLDTVRHIKKILSHRLPEVKSSHRVEALARGLGWKSNAALRACLLCAPTECSVSDTAFCAYLEARGFHTVAQDVFSKATIEAVSATEDHQVASRPPSIKSKSPTTQHNGFLSFFAGKTAFAAAFSGLFVALIYLAINFQAAVDRLDNNAEQILTAVEGPATRSVLIMDRELATQVVHSLLAFSHIESVRIYDDHGVLSAQAVRGQDANSAPSGIAPLLVAGGIADGKKEYTKAIKLPDGLGGKAILQITIDQNRGIAFVAGPTLSGLVLFFLIGALAVFVLVAAFAKLRRVMHGYLLATYQLQQA